ncbi:hypothetical protein J437_LFUL012627 [Ladona fulva]|uniref:Aconitate hydratase n=1 Tax=Ladona fulva TaxID=123851 RepID=A0A8K0KFY6_LADFU|nr:hypothetical protein J437_LFUL012627 [Ladona fulva]
MAGTNPYNHLLRSIEVQGKTYSYYDLTSLSKQYDKLPYSIRVLLESAVRNCDNFQVTQEDVDKVLAWNAESKEDTEIAFKPARVLLQDFTGVPAVVDFAAMRDAVSELGGDPQRINPICPSDLVIDHSVQWGANALRNMLIVPPGSGIVHQVNLEHLARVVFTGEGDSQEATVLYPDSVVGTDSHTTMINGLGVLGWGVGGFSLVVLQHLRQIGVVGCFVEFFGEGVAELSIADRATVSNMCPEYGATVGFFPVDAGSLQYLRLTNRDERHISVMEAYMKAVKLLRDYSDSSQDPVYSEIGFKGYGITEEKLSAYGVFDYEGRQFTLRHGSVVIAAITSCTNTSNPSVMLGAGLLAKKAVEAGLSVAPYIKTSLSPGSGVVTYYLRESGVIPYLEDLGFGIVGYGCMTCIGNSGPLPDSMVNAIEKNELVVCGVLSGNRNFEGRIHPNTRANYLASPLLVIAYAIAGRVDIDFEREPIGVNKDGKEVYLKEIWPPRNEIQEVERKFVIPAMFEEAYSKLKGNKGDGINDIFLSLFQELPPIAPIINARALLLLGDSVTTDHISPAGCIARNSPAARYLATHKLTPKEFNSYGSRRGNDEVMARGTFANVRLVNKLVGKAGPRTVHIPTGENMDVFDAAERYQDEGTPLIVVAGKDYGSGSSRDWAAKGPYLLVSLV